MTDKLVERVFAENLNKQSARLGIVPKATESPMNWGMRVRKAAMLEALESLTLPQTDLEQMASVLANELGGVHDALGHIPDFHVREPDLDMTRWTARAILRDAIAGLKALTKALASSSVPEQDSRMVGALEKFERVIRLADTLASDVPVTSAARQHITNAYAALADMLALASSSVPEQDSWQPIKTAPRDGTWFLAVATSPGWGATRIVRFKDPSDRLPIHGEGNMWPSAPTHWMPLPPPPAVSGLQDRGASQEDGR